MTFKICYQRVYIGRNVLSKNVADRDMQNVKSSDPGELNLGTE